MYESDQFTLFKDIEEILPMGIPIGIEGILPVGNIVGLGRWDIAAFNNGTISGSGYDFNISFTDEEGLFVCLNMQFQWDRLNSK